MTHDPTIITPDNLPEIGEMVECVYAGFLEEFLKVGHRYKVESLRPEYTGIKVQGMDWWYFMCYFRRLPENVKSVPVSSLVPALETERHQEIKQAAQESATQMLEAIRNDMNPDTVTILVDDEMLIEPLVKLLNKNKIDTFPSRVRDAKNTDVIRINEVKDVYFSDEDSKRGFKNLIPLSNWKEVRRSIEELVKPKETTVRMSYGGVAKINSENVAFWVGEMSIFEASKQDLQTILEKMK